MKALPKAKPRRKAKESVWTGCDIEGRLYHVTLRSADGTRVIAYNLTRDESESLEAALSPIMDRISF